MQKKNQNQTNLNFPLPTQFFILGLKSNFGVSISFYSALNSYNNPSLKVQRVLGRTSVSLFQCVDTGVCSEAVRAPALVFRQGRRIRKLLLSSLFTAENSCCVETDAGPREALGTPPRFSPAPRCAGSNGSVDPPLAPCAATVFLWQQRRTEASRVPPGRDEAPWASIPRRGRSSKTQKANGKAAPAPEHAFSPVRLEPPSVTRGR